MGLSSNVALLTLTQRKNDASLRLQGFATQKDSLLREMNRVSLKYKNALNSKVLKWSNNSGVSCVDLSYSNLMSPSNMNNNNPVLITNGSGKVVIGKNYKDYAEMISKEGKAGGDYSGDTRLNILSEITGISKETLQMEDSASSKAEEALEAMQKADKERYKYRKEYSQAQFCNLMGIDSNEKITSSNIDSFLKQAQTNLGKYLSSSDLKAFSSVCENAKTQFVSTDSKKGSELKDYLYGAYVQSGNASLTSDGKVYVFVKGGEGSAADYEEREAAYQSAKAAYQEALSSQEQLFTSEQERQIEFYDKLFTAIAECGWTNDEQISDNDYLNQMFQNNSFYITTMTENTSESSFDCEGKRSDTSEYYYNTDLWSDTSNIFAVNDDSIHEKALVDYESEKRNINLKEQRIDARMKILETEIESYKNMMETLKGFVKGNIEKTMNISG